MGEPARKMALFDIVARQKAILELVADQEGELTEAQAQEMESLDNSLERKVEASAKVILDLEDEAERYAKRAKRAQAQADWLRGTVLSNLMAAGVEKVKGEAYGVRVQRNPASAEILDQGQIPEKFLVPPPPPPPPSVDKRAVLAALKAGEVVAGAKLADPRFHLRIT